MISIEKKVYAKLCRTLAETSFGLQASATHLESNQTQKA